MARVTVENTLLMRTKAHNKHRDQLSKYIRNCSTKSSNNEINITCRAERQIILNDVSKLGTCKSASSAPERHQLDESFATLATHSTNPVDVESITDEISCHMPSVQEYGSDPVTSSSIIKYIVLFLLIVILNGYWLIDISKRQTKDTASVIELFNALTSQFDHMKHMGSPNLTELGIAIKDIKQQLAEIKHEPDEDEFQNIKDDIYELNMKITNRNNLSMKMDYEKLKCEIISDLRLQLNNYNSIVTKTDVQKMLKEALLIYDADKTGYADFALESGGGSIVSTECGVLKGYQPPVLSVFGISLWSIQDGPRAIIEPSMQPGKCWSFSGTRGSVIIKLSNMIYPTGFGMEHIPIILSPKGNINSAPKDFTVMVDIGIKFMYIKLIIESNHGHLDHTCVYRFRVHGNLVLLTTN